MQQESFLMRKEWEQHISLLSKEQRGDLITLIFAYQNQKELPDCDPMAKLAFSFMKPFFEDSAEKYAAQVRKNQENGKMGGRPKNPNNPVGFLETQPNQSEPNVTLSNVDTDSDSGSVSYGGEKRAGKPRFTPPTLAEVSAYVSERHSAVDPQEFIDFYGSKGWLVGKTPMKDWKAACRNAEKWDRWDRAKVSAKKSPQSGYFGGTPDLKKLLLDMDLIDKVMERGLEP